MWKGVVGGGGVSTFLPTFYHEEGWKNKDSLDNLFCSLFTHTHTHTQKTMPRLGIFMCRGQGNALLENLTDDAIA